MSCTTSFTRRNLERLQTLRSAFRWRSVLEFDGKKLDAATGLISSVQQAKGLAASTGMGSGAPSSADTLCGAQQALFNLVASARIALSSLSTDNVSRRILAAPAFAGPTIL